MTSPTRQACMGSACASRLRLALRAMALLAAGLLHVSAVFADDAKIDGFWVNNIVVDTITQGRLVYSVQGQEIERPLEQLTGLKLQVYPDMVKAADLLEAGKPAEALPLLRKVQGEAREPWVKTWLKYQQVAANDAAGKPVDAVNLFIELAIDPATEPTYVATPPLKSLVQASDDQRAQMAARVKDAADRARGEVAKASLQKIGTALATLGQMPADGQPIDPTTMVELGAAPSQSVIAMPRRVIEDDKDPIAAFLREGKFEEALKEADDQLSKPTATMSRLLYLKGLAQLYIADRNGDEKGYMDAGLSFMRVVSYFRLSTQWAVPSYLELAYIHQRIGRPDVAARLLGSEGVGVQLDPETDPELYERYRKIAGITDAPPAEAAAEN